MNTPMTEHVQHEKTEAGFYGSLILTSEHILGQVSGTLPVAGLFISAIGAFSSLVWHRDTLSTWQKGHRILLGLTFAALGGVVIAFPYTGLAVGLSVAIYSVASNLYEKFTHSKKASKTQEPNQTASQTPLHHHETPSHHKAIGAQHTRNSLMSMVALACIVISLAAPQIAPAILGLFITATLVYLVVTYAANRSTTNKNMVPPESEPKPIDSNNPDSPSPHPHLSPRAKMIERADRRWAIEADDHDTDSHESVISSDEENRLSDSPAIFTENIDSEDDSDDEGESESEGESGP